MEVSRVSLSVSESNLKAKLAATYSEVRPLQAAVEDAVKESSLFRDSSEEAIATYLKRRLSLDGFDATPAAVRYGIGLVRRHQSSSGGRANRTRNHAATWWLRE